MVDAKKTRMGRADALALAKSTDRVIVARGRNVVTFDMKKPPQDALLAGAILGPTGNLRAPTIRVGRTLVVGFNAEAYESSISGRG